MKQLRLYIKPFFNQGLKKRIAHTHTHTPFPVYKSFIVAVLYSSCSYFMMGKTTKWLIGGFRTTSRRSVTEVIRCTAGRRTG